MVQWWVEEGGGASTHPRRRRRRGRRGTQEEKEEEHPSEEEEAEHEETEAQLLSSRQHKRRPSQIGAPDIPRRPKQCHYVHLCDVAFAWRRRVLVTAPWRECLFEETLCSRPQMLTATSDV